MNWQTAESQSFEIDKHNCNLAELRKSDGHNNLLVWPILTIVTEILPYFEASSNYV